jgi:hypothetical protein
MDKHPRSGRKTPTGPKASEQTRALAITCEGKKTRDGGEGGEHSQGRLPHEEKIDGGQGSAHNLGGQFGQGLAQLQDDRGAGVGDLSVAEFVNRGHRKLCLLGGLHHDGAGQSPQFGSERLNVK